MADYVIGDVHGCYNELQKLLDLINFDIASDKLYFTGDLINGAPHTVAILEFLISLNDSAITVLGNHDLTLLVLADGHIDLNDFKIQKTGFSELLNHPDREKFLDWLCKRPLAHFIKSFNALLIHAGLYPFWGLEQVLELTQEVETILASDSRGELFQNMFGNLPEKWNKDLKGWDRTRFIINACTRMRFCSLDGRLELDTKGKAADAPIGFEPWFKVKNSNIDEDLQIIFGHWSALVGETKLNNIIALDTGCIWGNSLTAVRLQDKKKFSVACPKYCSY